MLATASVMTLECRNPFGLSRGSATEIPVFHLALEGGGIGHGSPVRYRGEDAGHGAALAVACCEAVTPRNLFDVAAHHERAGRICGQHSSARAAFDIALHDRIGIELGVPLHVLFGYGRAVGRPSAFTIAMDEEAVVARKVEEAQAFPVLKIKLGGPDPAGDERLLALVRRLAPDKEIWVDANGGWDREVARRLVRTCGRHGVALIEQPLDARDTEGLAELSAGSPAPIIADESVQGLGSLPRLAGKVDGINIKLMKCGGLWEARQMIAFARAVGWKIMLGCMIESGAGIAAAAHLASAADYLDLDAERLTLNNPATPGIMDSSGCITAPATAGLGVRLSSGSIQGPENIGT